MSHSETPALPALIAGEATRDGPVRSFIGLASVVEAQRLGQAQVRRGLRGGRPVLDAARAAYLKTQWSGGDDRRPEPGLVMRTRV